MGRRQPSNNLILKNSWIDYQNLKKQASAPSKIHCAQSMNEFLYYNGKLIEQIENKMIKFVKLTSIMKLLKEEWLK